MAPSSASRLDREEQFHDVRFADDSARAAAGKFYRVASDGLERYRSLVARSGTGRVLEYGCGTGSEAFDLAARGASVTAIDISSTAIEVAAAEASVRGVDLELVKMNAEELEFGDDSFDLVCGSGILHHLDTDRAAEQIRRVVSPGGRAVFLEPMGYNPLIKAYRSRTPGMRTVDEHPLLRRDLAAYEAVCSSMRLSFTGLAVLGAAPLIGRPGSAALTSVLRSIDSVLLELPAIRLLAWMVVIEMEF